MQAIIANPPFKAADEVHTYMVCVQWYDTHSVTNHIYYASSPWKAWQAFIKDFEDEYDRYGIVNIIRMD